MPPWLVDLYYERLLVFVPLIICLPLSILFVSRGSDSTRRLWRIGVAVALSAVVEIALLAALFMGEPRYNLVAVMLYAIVLSIFPASVLGGILVVIEVFRVRRNSGAI